MAPLSSVLGLLILPTLSLSRTTRRPAFLRWLLPSRGPAGQGSQQLKDGAAAFHRSALSSGHGVDFANFLEDAAEANASGRKVIWVTGFPRSGSSTLLSMVSVAAGNATKDESFALFEPCRDGDKVDEQLTSPGCEGLLRELSECTLDHVKNLWGWSDPHSSGTSMPFNSSHGASMCSNASRVTFKTVDYGLNLTRRLGFLDAHPDLHIVAAVRDPRGIWASWKTLEPFATLMKEGKFYTLEHVCKSLADNIDVRHPRISQVLFEKMVRHPWEVIDHVYASIGMKAGDAQDAWVKATFNNDDCPPLPEWQVGFDDCREDSKSVAEQWRNVLTEDELRRFNEDASCQAVKAAYGLGD